jgi:putative addiction module component (TIGR02574 family)
LGEPLNIFAFASLTRAAAARYNYSMNTSLFNQVRQLSVEEQIELVEALWDNIVERNAAPGPTEAQKAELDRRLSEHAAHPNDVVPWSEVKDSALTRIRR